MPLPSLRRSHSFFTVFACLLTAGLLFVVGCDSSGPGEEEPPPEGNGAPTAEAVTDAATVAPGDAVQLDGTGSSDPDGDELTYAWTLTAPDGSAAALSDPAGAEPSFTADVAGAYTATLSVSDGEADDSDEVTITAESGTTNCSTTEITDDIEEDLTLENICSDPADVEYIVTGRHQVEGETTLTIEPGVRVAFEADASLRVNGSGAALVAVGTAEAPIVLTGTQEQAGFWRGIGIDSGNARNEMTYVNISGGGSGEVIGATTTANVHVDREARLTLTNSTLRTSGGYGLSADREASLEGFSNNTFTENEDAPLNLQFPTADALDVASSYAGNQNDYVRLYKSSSSGNVSEGEVQLEALDVPYRVSANPNLDVEDNGTLTLAPGVRMAFEADDALRITDDGGALVAVGTAEAPIVLTGTQEQAGFWGGVLVDSDNAQNEMTHVEIAYGGSEEIIGASARANVYVDREKRLTLTNSTIRDSGGWGVYVDEEGVLDASGNTYSDNANGTVEREE